MLGKYNGAKKERAPRLYVHSKRGATRPRLEPHLCENRTTSFPVGMVVCDRIWFGLGL